MDLLHTEIEAKSLNGMAGNGPSAAERFGVIEKPDLTFTPEIAEARPLLLIWQNTAWM